MANKTKILNQAQRYIGKGQWDKAIRELQKLIAEEPNDVRTLLKLGDVYSKQGDREAATRVYRQVAESYSEQGFFLKAVAVFKQILKLDPQNVDIVLRLAELYQHLNLSSEALVQYQLAARVLDEQGQTKRSLETLRRMVSLEPANVASRIKLAEGFSKENMVSDAAQEFSQAAQLLREQNRLDDYIKVAERLVYHDPTRLDVVRDVAKLLLSRGDTKRGLAKLQILYKDDAKDVETLRLLARAFQDLGQTQKTLFVFRELARVHMESGRPGDANQVYRQILEIDPQDVEALQALGPESGAPPGAPPSSAPSGAAPVPTAPTSSSERMHALTPMESNRAAVPVVPPGARVPTDDLPLVGPSLSPRPAPPPQPPGPRSAIPPPPPPRSADLPDEELDFGGAAAPPQRPPPARPPPPAASQDLSAPLQGAGPTQELEKILTETDVFVRYGLRDKALEHLQKVFVLQPDCVPAYEKMRDIHKAANDLSRAGEAVASIIQIYARQGDAENSARYQAELAELVPGHPLAAGEPSEDLSSDNISIDITEDSGVFEVPNLGVPNPDIHTIEPLDADIESAEPDPFAGSVLDQDDSSDAFELELGGPEGGFSQDAFPTEEVPEGLDEAFADPALFGPEDSDPADPAMDLLVELDPFPQEALQAEPPPAREARVAESVRVPDVVFDIPSPSAEDPDAEAGAEPLLAIESFEPGPASEPPAGESPRAFEPPPGRGVVLLEELEAEDGWPAELPVPPGGVFGGGRLEPDPPSAPPPPSRPPPPPQASAQVGPPAAGLEIGADLSDDSFSLLSTDLAVGPDPFEALASDPDTAAMSERVSDARDPAGSEPEPEAVTSVARLPETGPASDPADSEADAPGPAPIHSQAPDVFLDPVQLDSDVSDPFGPAAMRLGGSAEEVEEPPTQHVSMPGLADAPEEFEDDISDELDEAEFMLEAGLEDEARDLLEELRSRVPSSERAARLWAQLHGEAEPGEEETQIPRDGEPFENSEPRDAAGNPSGQVTADLAAHVEAMLDESVDLPASEDSFDQGMMYRELGRMDDAIREFRAAARSERRAIDSLEMIGHCLVDKDEPKAAIECFKLALKKGAQGPAATNLKYEIGSAYERLNDLPRAKDWYQACHRDDPAHRDVEVRLSSVQERGGGPGGAGPRSSRNNKISYL